VSGKGARQWLAAAWPPWHRRNMAADIAPVPGRVCGDCTVCCTAMAIDKPEIQKEAGVTCRYCRGGCTIQDHWPALCRDYFCGWRRLKMMDENWRPDRSGVLAEVEQAGGDMHINLVLVGNPLKTIRQPWFVDFVAASVRKGLQLSLGIPGPRGHQGASLLIATRQMWDAAGASRAQVKALLEADLTRLQTYDFPPRLIRNRGKDFGSPERAG
jgi:hypothetical protein